MNPTETERASILFRESERRVYKRTDAMFGVLFIVQFIGSVLAAFMLTPRTWAGEQSSLHVHVLAGIGIGLLLCVMPLTLIVLRRGDAITRYTIAAAQMMFSALLIHLSGGRIETHFHVFGSLAFLAVYRDWKVLVPATLVVLVDHLFRGIFWPQSVFGVLAASPWRAFEHAGWVVFENVFLVVSCVQSKREMATIAQSRAALEAAHASTEQLVEDRTAELSERTLALSRSEERFRLAVRGSQHGVWDWDLASNTIYYAPQWKHLIGGPADAISNSPDEWFGRIVSGHLARFHEALTELRSGKTEMLDIELEMSHADGSVRWMLCRAIADRDAEGNATRLAGSLADISELKAAQERLRQLAHHDRLTGLPNRGVFTDRVSHAIARAKRSESAGFAVLFGDFDGFKVVNDSLGHAIGDAMLIRAADRFREEVRESDTVARFGGDEFAVLLEDTPDQKLAMNTARRLIDAFRAPFTLKGHEVCSTLSLGLVMSGPGYETADDLLRDADAAMYQAKSSGKSRCQVFDEKMHQAALRRLDTERELRRATQSMETMDGSFRLDYQPIVDLTDARIIGFEALVRWVHPVNGRVSPDKFIPVAEETGTIIPMGEWVTLRACEQMAAWRRIIGPNRPFVMNINLSRRQLLHRSLTTMLKESIQKSGARIEDIKLEITETALMDERVDAVEILNGIRSLGFELAMDDFGTGQSSLSCLRNFPIQTLKIDRAFLLNMTQQREFSAVMHAIITLAHNLNLDVVAEGLETDAQLAQLQAMDCRSAQGFLFSHPVEAAAAERMLDGGLPIRQRAA